VSPKDYVVVVVGATGLVGRHVVNGLARAGREVRAVARRPPAQRSGVTAWPLDVRDADGFNAVLRGADAIFMSLPPTLQGADLARIAGDIARADISAAVLLSSDLVQQYPGSFMAASHEREEAVLGSALGESLVTLRPGVFMDNDATEWSATIRADYSVLTAFPDALQVPIASVDIAAEAIAALTSPDRATHAPQRLLGPQWLCVRDRVAVLAGVLNRPITISEVSTDMYRAQLARLLPEPIAAQKVAMLYAAPRSIRDCPDLPLGQGRTPPPMAAAPTPPVPPTPPSPQNNPPAPPLPPIWLAPPVPPAPPTPNSPAAPPLPPFVPVPDPPAPPLPNNHPPGAPSAPVPGAPLAPLPIRARPVSARKGALIAPSRAC
jgi:uncharacterized protein YbjT (DUF2867 family)